MPRVRQRRRATSLQQARMVAPDQRVPRVLTSIPTMKTPVRQFRTIPWGNTKTGKTQYGLQSRMNISGERWVHCINGKSVMLFDTPEAARAEIRVIRKRMKNLGVK